MCDSLSTVPVKRLKELLRAKCIDCSGCVEKHELKVLVLKHYTSTEIEEELAIAASGTAEKTGTAESTPKKVKSWKVSELKQLLHAHNVDYGTAGLAVNDLPV